MAQKIALIRILISLYLINTYAFAQLQLSISTDKQNYNYGESIIIECSVKNLADTTTIVWAGNHSTCQAEFSFNNYNSWEHTVCLPTTERIEIKSGDSRVYKWIIDPKKYGLPNKDGEQKIVGYFLGGLKDSITINAPKYYGGQLSVGFFDSLESEINLIKDTLNVEVLSRSDFGLLGIGETWQIEGFSIDSLVEKYSNDTRFKYAENNVFSAYDSIYSVCPLCYYPLHIGDKWQYKVNISHIASDSISEIIIASVEIIGDTVIQNIKYFIRESVGMETNIYGNSTNEFLRIDSVTGLVYNNKISKENVVDSLFASENDTTNFFYVEEIYFNNILGLETESKLYSSTIISSYDYFSWELSKYIGLSRTVYADAVRLIKYEHELVYAKINGKEFGTLVGIEKNINNIPEEFTLLQNYPNPFNPTTAIQYTIPNLTHSLIPSREGKERSDRGVLQNVILKVYDILGKEVTTLINQQQKFGSYEVMFDASKLSSGVYYYQLKAGDFVRTKKMIYLK